MATVKLTQKEQHILRMIATKPTKTGWVRYFDLQNHNNGFKHLERLQAMGLIEWKSGKGQRLTVAGLAYLYQDAPMVDQPQPIDAATIEGEVSFYADGKAQDGTIVCGTDRFGYTVRGVNGTVYDEVQRGDIEPRLGDELDDLPFSEKPQPAPVDDDYDYSAEWDAYVTQREREHFNSPEYGTDEDTVTYDDLPFSDLGEPDDEDTKELPAIMMQHTPCSPTRPTIGDAIKLPLDKLIDAALDPDNTDAYEALKAYDLASVPLWVLEIERDDVNAYKWDVWHEHRKMVGGILLSTPEAIYKGREVDRAFNVMEILNKAFEQGVK